MTLAVVTVRCNFDGMLSLDDVCMMMIMVMMMTFLEPLMIDILDGPLHG